MSPMPSLATDVRGGDPSAKRPAWQRIKAMRVAGYHLATFNARSSDTRAEIRQREPVIFHIDTLPFRLSTGLIYTLIN
jgi:hypothetical protein